MMGFTFYFGRNLIPSEIEEMVNNAILEYGLERYRTMKIPQLLDVPGRSVTEYVSHLVNPLSVGIPERPQYEKGYDVTLTFRPHNFTTEEQEREYSTFMNNLRSTLDNMSRKTREHRL